MDRHLMGVETAESGFQCDVDLAGVDIKVYQGVGPLDDALVAKEG